MKTVCLPLFLVAGCGSGGIAPPGNGDAGVRDFSSASGDDLLGSDAALSAMDLASPPPSDGGGTFSDTLDGIWMVGWSGGLNHYSWLRFHGTGMANDAVEILEPSGGAWVGYWMGCSGAGKWTLAVKPNTVQVSLPNGCPVQSAVFTFKDFYPPNGQPPGAILDSHVDTNPVTQALDGWKFPPSQCDVAFTTCTLPF